MKTIGYIIVTFKFWEEDKRWVACCEELGTSTFGHSLPEAKERLKEAVTLHLNALEDLGERERFFKENSIRLYTHRPKLKNVTVTAPLDRETLVQSHIQPLRELVSA